MEWQQQQEQDNESGIDMHDCYHYHHPLPEQWHEKNRRLLDGFDKLRPIIKGEKIEQNRNNECSKAPF